MTVVAMSIVLFQWSWGGRFAVQRAVTPKPDPSKGAGPVWGRRWAAYLLLCRRYGFARSTATGPRS
jgi:hypothetical protein